LRKGGAYSLLPIGPVSKLPRVWRSSIERKTPPSPCMKLRGFRPLCKLRSRTIAAKGTYS
jgi:hypothetical protein